MADPEALQVDTAELRAVAGRVAEVGATLGKALSGRSANFIPPGAASWVTVDAAKLATADWEVFVRQLADSVSGISADLRSTADSYDRADLDSAQRFRQDRRFPD